LSALGLSDVIKEWINDYDQTPNEALLGLKSVETKFSGLY